jgi:hypothetical protein
MSGAHRSTNPEPRPAFGRIYPGYPLRLIQASLRSRFACLWALEHLIEYCRYGRERYIAIREFQRRYRLLGSGGLLRRPTAVDGRKLAMGGQGGRVPLLKAVSGGTGLSPLVFPLVGVDRMEKGWGILYEHEPRFWATKKLSVRQMAICCELKRKAGSSSVAIVTGKELGASLRLSTSKAISGLRYLSDHGTIKITVEDHTSGFMSIDVMTGFVDWYQKVNGIEPLLLPCHSPHGPTLEFDSGTRSNGAMMVLPETVPPGARNRTQSGLKPYPIEPETVPKLEPEPKNQEEGPNAAQVPIKGGKAVLDRRSPKHSVGWKYYRELMDELGLTSIPRSLESSTGQLACEFQQWKQAGLRSELASEPTWMAVRAMLASGEILLSKAPFKVVDFLQDHRGNLLCRRTTGKEAAARLEQDQRRTFARSLEVRNLQAMCKGELPINPTEPQENDWEGRDVG